MKPSSSTVAEGLGSHQTSTQSKVWGPTSETTKAGQSVESCPQATMTSRSISEKHFKDMDPYVRLLSDLLDESLSAAMEEDVGSLIRAFACLELARVSSKYWTLKMIFDHLKRDGSTRKLRRCFNVISQLLLAELSCAPSRHSSFHGLMDGFVSSMLTHSSLGSKENIQEMLEIFHRWANNGIDFRRSGMSSIVWKLQDLLAKHPERSQHPAQCVTGRKRCRDTDPYSYYGKEKIGSGSIHVPCHHTPSTKVNTDFRLGQGYQCH